MSIASTADAGNITDGSAIGGPTVEDSFNVVESSFASEHVLVGFDDFVSGLQSGASGWAISTNGVGVTASANPVADSTAFGYFALSGGTNTNARASISMEAVAGQLPLVQPWLAGVWVQEWRVKFVTLPDITNDGRIGLSLGAGATAALASFSSGVGLRYDRLNANWILCARHNSVETSTQSTGVAPVADTWQYLRVEIRSTGARCYIGNTKAAAESAGIRASIAIGDITTTNALGPIAKMYRVAGTCPTVRIDFHSYKLSLTTPR